MSELEENTANCWKCRNLRLKNCNKVYMKKVYHYLFRAIYQSDLA